MPHALRFSLAGLLLSASLANAQAPTPPASGRILKAADLQVDFVILRKAYESLHPGLYRYNTRTEMNGKFEALRSRLSQDQSLQDAYLAFSVFAAQIKCGHTYPNFFNQRKAVAAALFQGTDRVPFYFHWVNHRMIATEDFTPDRQIPRGTEITSINGTPVGTILNRLLTVSRADGANDAKRVAYLEVTGDSTYEAFDVYFPMFFPQKSNTLQLMAKRPGEPAPRTLVVAALTFEQRIAPIQEREGNRKGGDAVLFEWKYLEDGLAYLRMPTWALYDSKWDWKAWLGTHLDDLSEKQSPALILDLRGNEGGMDVGNEILPRLITKELRVESYRRLVRYRETPTDLNPYLDTWDKSFQNWGAAALPLAKPWPTAPPVPYFALTKYDDAKGGDVLRPAGKPYRGRVYVLVDANNSSATFQFAQIVQQKKLGTLVGQPTGGNQRGINGGAFFFLRLPKSEIEMDLPLIGAFPLSPRPDSGLSPDLPVTVSGSDIMHNVDTELARIRRQSKP